MFSFSTIFFFNSALFTEPHKLWDPALLHLEENKHTVNLQPGSLGQETIRPLYICQQLTVHSLVPTVHSGGQKHLLRLYHVPDSVLNFRASVRAGESSAVNSANCPCRRPGSASNTHIGSLKTA